MGCASQERQLKEGPKKSGKERHSKKILLCKYSADSQALAPNAVCACKTQATPTMMSAASIPKQLKNCSAFDLYKISQGLVENPFA
jgi:hypothetical protein